MTLIEFTEVRKTFGIRTGRRTDALAAVSFAVNAGEAVAIVGPNGAGKSTLLALVLGFLRPTAGDIAVGGALASEWVRRHGAGWLPERFEPPAEWTVASTLRAFASLEGDDARSRVPGLLDHWGLAPHAKKSVHSLSRGLLQRLGLAQAVMAGRSLVILDEPTNGLDPDGRRLFREAVTTLRTGGATLLIASQDLSELERVTDRAIVLEGGRVRDIIDVAPPKTTRTWTLRTSAPADVVHDIFADARLVSPAAGEPARWAVTIGDVESLNDGLGRLLAAGGLLFEVAPATPTLEERILRPEARPEAAQ